MESPLLIVNLILGCVIAALVVMGRRAAAAAAAGAADPTAAEAAAKAAAADAEATREAIRQFESRLTEAVARNERSTRDTLVQQVTTSREEQGRAAQTLRTELDTKLSLQHAQAVERLEAMRVLTERKLNEAREATQLTLDKVRETTQQQLTQLREENQKKLDEMRGVVDKQLNETLQTRIGQAFEQVSKQLEQVHQQLGQVQALTTNVTDLRKTLEGVKTRGVFGEAMLEGMLEEFLHPQQYERNFKAKPRSNEQVEFAIKLPNRDEHGGDDPVWLPIDAKFPKESYERLLACLELGDLAGAETERKQLLNAVMSFARDIRDKYIAPPRTTNFAILYLPLESLFAEVVREPGFIERIQSECNVTLCSPTTLAAYLNALQMGFRTLAVQKQSAEIQKLLAVVRKQFQSFGEELAKVEKKLDESRNAVAQTVKRTQMIDGKLKGIDVEGVGEGDVMGGLPGVGEVAAEIRVISESVRGE